jgi:hypothetical protein
VLWTAAEIQKFLLGAPAEWRAVWLVGIFTGLRPGEIQAMCRSGQNWPDFTGDWIHVTHAYGATSKVLGAPKTELSIRRRRGLKPSPDAVLSSLLQSDATGTWLGEEDSNPR